MKMNAYLGCCDCCLKAFSSCVASMQLTYWSTGSNAAKMQFCKCNQFYAAASHPACLRRRRQQHLKSAQTLLVPIGRGNMSAATAQHYLQSAQMQTAVENNKAYAETCSEACSRWCIQQHCVASSVLECRHPSQHLKL